MTGARSAKVAGGLNCLNHLDFEHPGFQDTERCTASHGTPGNSWESLPIPMHLDLWPMEPVVHRACLWHLARGIPWKGGLVRERVLEANSCRCLARNIDNSRGVAGFSWWA